MRHNILDKHHRPILLKHPNNKFKTKTDDTCDDDEKQDESGENDERSNSEDILDLNSKSITITDDITQNQSNEN